MGVKQVSDSHISGGEGRYTISGELSFSTVNAILVESKKVIFSKPAAEIELDLSGVTRADSAGLALLIQWMRIARSHNSKVHFLHLPEQLKAIASAGEVTSLLPVTG